MKKQKILITIIIGLIVGFMCFGGNSFAVNETNTSSSTQEDSSDVMYVKSEVNFRSGQSTSSKSYGMISGGTEVTVLQKNSNGWYEIEYNGKTGFVSRTYLTETKPDDKKGKNDKKDKEDKNSLCLETLTIEYVTLTPEFTKNTYEYTGELTEQVTSVKVDAKSNDENADVEISGNKEMLDGENIITILVKGKDETVTYQITVNKKSAEEFAAAKEETNGGLQINPTIAIAAAVALLVILIIILVIRNHSKNKVRAREFSMPYEPRKDREDGQIDQKEEKINKEKYKEKYLNQFEKTNEQNEDIPKAIRKKKEQTELEDYEDDDKPNRRGRGKHF